MLSLTLLASVTCSIEKTLQLYAIHRVVMEEIVPNRTLVAVLVAGMGHIVKQVEHYFL